MLDYAPQPDDGERFGQAPPFLSITETAGDFAHVRQRGVYLACCCCTTCCFTILLGGAGGLIGLIAGIVKVSSRPSGTSAEGQKAGCLLGLIRIVVYFVCGVMIGGAAGLGIDMIFTFR